MASKDEVEGLVGKDDRLPAQNERAQFIVEDTLREFGVMQLQRNVTASQWEEVAEILSPNDRNTFFYGNYNWPGEKKTQRQIDANGQQALEKFKAICDSLLTPRNMYWHQLEADIPEVQKDRQARLWYEQATHALFKMRYAYTANFGSQNQMVFHSLGAYGTAGIYVDELFEQYGPGRGVRYRAIPLGELFIKENHQGLVDGFIRWYRLDARQARMQYPEAWEAGLLKNCQSAFEQKSQMKFDFLHHVYLRGENDYDPDRRDYRGKKWASCHVSISNRTLVKEGGYHSFPLPISRYVQAPGETYGRGPAMMVLPALKTLNAEKATFLKQGHRASDPVLLTVDDGLFDYTMRPGSKVAGGMSPEGKPLVGILPTGEIQISKEMMAEEKALIMDAFLVTLFQILTETPQMTATEVIERTNEKGILLAPTVGRQQSEYLGPLISREIDLAIRLRLLPPPPGIIRESGAGYNAVYTSPISRAMRAQEAAGFMRTVESVKELVNITGDPSLLDQFNFDVAIPQISQIEAVPESWMATEAQVAQKRKNRAQAQKAQQDIQAMPAQAAMLKAQAVVNKNQPGVAPGQAFGGPQAQGGLPSGPPGPPMGGPQ
jgi:hypothetical protein